jgi:hypothetical protein
MNISKEVLKLLLKNSTLGYGDFMHIEMCEDDVVIAYDYYGNVIQFIEGEQPSRITFPIPSAMPNDILEQVKDYVYEELADDELTHSICAFMQMKPEEKNKLGFPYYGLMVHYQKSMGLKEYVNSRKTPLFK